jgi:hypothetical protein
VTGVQTLLFRSDGRRLLIQDNARELAAASASPFKAFRGRHGCCVRRQRRARRQPVLIRVVRVAAAGRGERPWPHADGGGGRRLRRGPKPRGASPREAAISVGFGLQAAAPCGADLGMVLRVDPVPASGTTAGGWRSRSSAPKLLELFSPTGLPNWAKFTWYNSLFGLCFYVTAFLFRSSKKSAQQLRFVLPQSRSGNLRSWSLS